MTFVQHGHPAGQREIQLPHRELIQHLLQDGVQCGGIQVQTADGQHAAAIALLQLGRQGPGLRGVRVGAVEEDDKGLAQRFQLLHHPLLRREVAFPGDLADGAIRRDHDADGGVVGDDLAGTRFCRQVKGDLLLKPGALDHPGLVILLVAHGPLHHVAHTVDEAYPALAPALQCQRHCRFRDELGLGSHDGTPRRRLGQLIPGAEAGGLRPHGRQHQLLHKPLDECTLPCPHRPHHPDEDVAARPCTDLPADRILLQHFLLFQSALPSRPVLAKFMRLSFKK